ncbi:MAG: hypothetical protein ACE5FY_01385 [Nitrospiria bacterium]
MGKRIKDIKEGKGFIDLLIGQFLLAVLLYVAVAFYEKSREATMVVSFFLIIGVLYYSFRGMKSLWYKGKKR